MRLLAVCILSLFLSIFFLKEIFLLVSGNKLVFIEIITKRKVLLLPGSKRLHREVRTGRFPPGSAEWHPPEEELPDRGYL